MTLKKGRIRKHSLNTIPQLKFKADKALQNYFRRVKTKCELCPKPYQVAHHFIPKKLSNYLRYDEKNLIFLCNSCHFKVHHDDPIHSLNEKIKEIRGKEWVNYIESVRHNFKKDNRQDLEDIFKKYDIP